VAVTITGDRAAKFGLCSALRAFEQGGIFIVPHLGLYGLIRKTDTYVPQWDSNPRRKDHLIIAPLRHAGGSTAGLQRSVDRSINYLLFYVPLENLSLIWRRHHCRWRAAKFRSVLGVPSHWTERGLHRATPDVTQSLVISGLTRRTTLFSRLLRHARGCWGSILFQILTGPHSVASYDTKGGDEDLFLPGSSRVVTGRKLKTTSIDC
jgi:hypothetical protein